MAKLAHRCLPDLIPLLSAPIRSQELNVQIAE